MIRSPYLVAIAPEVDDEDWKLRGACRGYDPEIFFPEGRAEELARPAKKVCRECPVIVECREWALGRNELGVWGGLTYQERRRIQRRRGARFPVFSSGRHALSLRRK